MNAKKCGLYKASDFPVEPEGSTLPETGAATLAAQSSGMLLVCALALDAVAYGEHSEGFDAAEVAGAVSHLLLECREGVAAAVGLLS